MAEKATKITRVEIKGLWGRYDLVWNLRPDVNILSGINGSGKSTILKGVEDALESSQSTFRYRIHTATIDSIKLEFQNNMHFNQDKQVDNSEEFSPVAFDGLRHQYISTFELSVNHIPHRGTDDWRTTLDIRMDDLQEKYVEYQLILSKRQNEILRKKTDNAQKLALDINITIDRFLEILDDCFAETDKRVEREKTKLAFLNGDFEISHLELSSGEKMLFVILMTVLVQDNHPSILLMDEPEISLHFDWQKKLIGYIRELNPNCQVILATHSPAIIMEGWMDHVFEVRDLITLDRNAVPQ